MNRRTMLKGGLVLAATAHTAALAPIIADPLLDAIMSYRAGVRKYAAIPDADLLAGDEDEIAQACYGQAYDVIVSGSAQATSLAGVREAIRLALDQRAFDCRLSEGAARSALAYLESLNARLEI